MRATNYATPRLLHISTPAAEAGDVAPAGRAGGFFATAHRVQAAGRAQSADGERWRDGGDEAADGRGRQRSQRYLERPAASFGNAQQAGKGAKPGLLREQAIVRR